MYWVKYSRVAIELFVWYTTTVGMYRRLFDLMSVVSFLLTKR